VRRCIECRLSNLQWSRKRPSNCLRKSTKRVSSGDVSEVTDDDIIVLGSIFGGTGSAVLLASDVQRATAIRRARGERITFDDVCVHAGDVRRLLPRRTRWPIVRAVCGRARRRRRRRWPHLATTHQPVASCCCYVYIALTRHTYLLTI
jgi:hypothetical protein